MCSEWHPTARQVFVLLFLTIGFLVASATLYPLSVTAQTQLLAQVGDVPEAQTTTTPQQSIQSLGIANYVTIENTENLVDGNIIIHVNNVYRISQEAYDKSMIGVYDSNPALAFEPQNTDNQVPIITTGTVEVLVNTSNGSIAKGDPITSSATAGIGMKATKSGFILGVAQEDFSLDGETGLIPVMLDIKFAFGKDAPESELISNRLLTLVSASTLAAIEEPAVAFRTVVAALLVIVSFVVAFLTFARIAQKGIDALGRNPLASRMITVGIVMNILVSLLIIASGIVGAYFLITL